MNVMISFVTTWPGTMIGKPGGYGITNFAETSSGPLRQSLVDRLAVELDVLAVRGVVGHVVRLAHVTFLRGALRVVAEGVVEALEVRQVGHVLDQRLHPRLERRLLRLAALGRAACRSPAPCRPGP